MTKEPKQMRTDGFESTWGEWREETIGKVTRGEQWTELLKEEDDYWERKSERYTEYARPPVQDIANALDEVEAAAPRILRSGICDFKNNRNFLKVV